MPANSSLLVSKLLFSWCCTIPIPYVSGLLSSRNTHAVLFPECKAKQTSRKQQQNTELQQFSKFTNTNKLLQNSNIRNDDNNPSMFAASFVQSDLPTTVPVTTLLVEKMLSFSDREYQDYLQNRLVDESFTDFILRTDDDFAEKDSRDVNDGGAMDVDGGAMDVDGGALDVDVHGTTGDSAAASALQPSLGFAGVEQQQQQPSNLSDSDDQQQAAQAQIEKDMLPFFTKLELTYITPAPGKLWNGARITRLREHGLELNVVHDFFEHLKATNPVVFFGKNPVNFFQQACNWTTLLSQYLLDKSVLQRFCREIYLTWRRENLERQFSRIDLPSSGIAASDHPMEVGIDSDELLAEVFQSDGLGNSVPSEAGEGAALQNVEDTSGSSLLETLNIRIWTWLTAIEGKAFVSAWKSTESDFSVFFNGPDFSGDPFDAYCFLRKHASPARLKQFFILFLRNFHNEVPNEWEHWETLRSKIFDSQEILEFLGVKRFQLCQRKNHTITGKGSPDFHGYARCFKEELLGGINCLKVDKKRFMPDEDLEGHVLYKVSWIPEEMQTRGPGKSDDVLPLDAEKPMKDRDLSMLPFVDGHVRPVNIKEYKKLFCSQDSPIPQFAYVIWHVCPSDVFLPFLFQGSVVRSGLVWIKGERFYSHHGSLAPVPVHLQRLLQPDTHSIPDAKVAKSPELSGEPGPQSRQAPQEAQADSVSWKKTFFLETVKEIVGVSVFKRIAQELIIKLPEGATRITIYDMVDILKSEVDEDKMARIRKVYREQFDIPLINQLKVIVGEEVFFAAKEEARSALPPGHSVVGAKDLFTILKNQADSKTWSEVVQLMLENSSLWNIFNELKHMKDEADTGADIDEADVFDELKRTKDEGSLTGESPEEHEPTSKKRKRNSDPASKIKVCTSLADLKNDVLQKRESYQIFLANKGKQVLSSQELIMQKEADRLTLKISKIAVASENDIGHLIQMMKTICGVSDQVRDYFTAKFPGCWYNSHEGHEGVGFPEADFINFVFEKTNVDNFQAFWRGLRKLENIGTKKVELEGKSEWQKIEEFVVPEFKLQPPDLAEIPPGLELAQLDFGGDRGSGLLQNVLRRFEEDNIFSISAFGKSIELTQADFGYKFRHLQREGLHVSRSLSVYRDVQQLVEIATESLGHNFGPEPKDIETKEDWLNRLNIVVNTYDSKTRPVLPPHFDSLRYEDRIYGLVAQRDESSPRLEFRPVGERNTHYFIPEEVGTVFCMTGDSRYNWHHTIQTYEGQDVAENRMSLTWRVLRKSVTLWLNLRNEDLRLQWVQNFINKLHPNDFKFIKKSAFGGNSNLEVGPLLKPSSNEDDFDLIDKLQQQSQSMREQSITDGKDITVRQALKLQAKWEEACPADVENQAMERDLFQEADLREGLVSKKEKPQEDVRKDLHEAFKIGTQHEAYPHQIKAVEACIKKYFVHRQQSDVSPDRTGGTVLRVAAGAGKSKAIALLSLVLAEAKLADLILVMNSRTVLEAQLWNQTCEKFLRRNFSLPDQSYRQAASERELQDIISSAQFGKSTIGFAMVHKMRNLWEKFEGTKSRSEEWNPLSVPEGLRVVVIADECHKEWDGDTKSAWEAIKKLLPKTNKFFIGFSATPQKDHPFLRLSNNAVSQREQFAYTFDRSDALKSDVPIIRDVVGCEDDGWAILDCEETETSEKVARVLKEFREKSEQFPKLQAMVHVRSHQPSRAEENDTGIPEVQNWAREINKQLFDIAGGKHDITVAAVFSGDKKTSYGDFNYGLKFGYKGQGLKKASILVVCNMLEEGYDNPDLKLFARDRNYAETFSGRASMVQSLSRACRVARDDGGNPLPEQPLVLNFTVDPAGSPRPDKKQIGEIFNQFDANVEIYSQSRLKSPSQHSANHKKRKAQNGAADDRSSPKSTEKKLSNQPHKCSECGDILSNKFSATRHMQTCELALQNKKFEPELVAASEDAPPPLLSSSDRSSPESAGAGAQPQPQTEANIYGCPYRSKCSRTFLSKRAARRCQCTHGENKHKREEEDGRVGNMKKQKTVVPGYGKPDEAPPLFNVHKGEEHGAGETSSGCGAMLGKRSRSPSPENDELTRRSADVVEAYSYWEETTKNIEGMKSQGTWTQKQDYIAKVAEYKFYVLASQVLRAFPNEEDRNKLCSSVPFLRKDIAQNKLKQGDLNAKLKEYEKRLSKV